VLERLELPRSLPKRIALLLLVPFYVSAGVNHFVNPEFYVAIMPPWLPLLNPEQFSAQLPVWAIYARLPFQFVFIAWAIWATRPD
jgi:uncharacterized membrane protein